MIATLRLLRGEGPASTEDDFIFSCRLRGQAVQLLQSRLAPSSVEKRSDAADAAWMPEAVAGARDIRVEQLVHAAAATESQHDYVFFSVVRKRPSLMHRASSGFLNCDDVGIMLHQFLKPLEDGVVAVDMAALSLKSVVTEQIGYSASALLLHARALPLQALLNARAWKVEKHKLHLSFRRQDGCCEETLQEVLHAVVRPQGLYVDHLPKSVRVSAQQLLQSWLASNLVEQGPTPNGPWCLSAGGHEVLRAGLRARVGRGDFLLPSSVTVPDNAIETLMNLSMFELLVLVESREWECRVAEARKKKEPYEDGKAKVWYAKPTKCRCSASLQLYLVCLLCSSEHGQAVPHFAAQSVYEMILGIRKQSAKTRKRKAEHDEWASDVEMDKPSSKQRRRESAQPQPFAGSAAVDAEFLLHEAAGASDGDGAAVSSSSPPTSPKSKATPSAKGASSSSSSTSKSSSSRSSSTSSSKSTSSAQARGIDVSKGTRKAEANDQHPQVDGRVRGRAEGFRMFGHGHFLTPRVKGGETTGWQVTCLNPSHQGGSTRCTKEVAKSVAGSEQAARQFLKASSPCIMWKPKRRLGVGACTRQDRSA